MFKRLTDSSIVRNKVPTIFDFFEIFGNFLFLDDNIMIKIVVFKLFWPFLLFFVIFCKKWKKSLYEKIVRS